MKTKSLIKIFAAASVLLITGCSADNNSNSTAGNTQTANTPDPTLEQAQEEKEYYDEEFLQAFSKAIQDRWAITSQMEGEEVTNEDYVRFVQVELDALDSLRDKKIEDRKLFENQIVYMNALDAQMEAIQAVIKDPDHAETALDDWNNAGLKRFNVITDIYDNYDLSIDSRYLKYVNKCRNTVYTTNYGNDSFWDMLNKWSEKTENGYQCFTITNSTKYTFKDLDIVVQLYEYVNNDYNYLGDVDVITLGEWRAGDSTTIRVDLNKVNAMLPAGKTAAYSLNWR